MKIYNSNKFRKLKINNTYCFKIKNRITKTQIKSKNKEIKKVNIINRKKFKLILIKI
ncbi:hypothetical protein [Candidatus Vidania fulgoroideorum]